jgi:hypothetical protein
MNMPLLASLFADATPAELGAWVYGLATVLQIASTIAILVTVNSKQKREVSFAGDPVDRKDFERHAAEDVAVHNQLFAKLGGVERGAAATVKEYEISANESRRAMHTEITEIKERVAGLESRTEMIDRRIVQIDSKLDHISERIR